MKLYFVANKEKPVPLLPASDDPDLFICKWVGALKKCVIWTYDDLPKAKVQLSFSKGKSHMQHMGTLPASRAFVYTTPDTKVEDGTWTIQARVETVEKPTKKRAAEAAPTSSTGPATVSTPDAKAVKVAEKPAPRWGHVAVLTPTNEVMIFGGQSTKLIADDGLWLYTPATKTWRKCSTRGATIAKRTGHTATLVKNKVYIFGGSQDARWLGDVHTIAMDTMEITKLDTQGKSPTRAYHSATLVGDKIYVFGGTHLDACLNDVHMFDTVTHTWTKVTTSGTPPSARSGHTATLIGKSKIYIFGGWDQPLKFNDIFVFDTASNKWEELKPAGTPPSLRTWHSATLAPGDRLLIFGGYDGLVAMNDVSIYDAESNAWVESMPTKIDPRAGHTATLVHNKLVIFGGGDNNDHWYNNVASFTVVEED